MIQPYMDNHARLATFINKNSDSVGKVVDFDTNTDKLFHLDLTANNIELEADTFGDDESFNHWIESKLAKNNCRYGVGGYMENRTIYSRSSHFDTADEPRRLHLGVDIWAASGTPVYSPLTGTVHSFNDNDNFGDYGPTIILVHDLNGLILYSLYGHLNRESLNGLSIGKTIAANQKIANFGTIDENGHWPPHLHFQLMFDMEGKIGDYPGVCKYSEKEKYLLNIPDPQLILQFPKAVNRV
jgi:murein DD-endopeptidase MepM/ murein hydrolase activator NlpD